MSRVEVSVYNEATGFVITSKNLDGRNLSDLESGSEEWNQAVAEGVFLPVSLVQDNSITVRVVCGETLNAEEAAEWVDHWTGRLVIRDGVLTITGGMEYLWGEEMEEYTEYAPVPPGEYRADFYTYLPGINGDYCRDSVPEDADAFGGGKEPLGAYFRRTRPGETFPLWLRAECIDDPDIDPGHEGEWDEESWVDDENAPGYLDFLLHLTPITPTAHVPVQESPLLIPPVRGEEEDWGQGWISISVQPRKPELCPMGLIAATKEMD